MQDCYFRGSAEGAQFSMVERPLRGRCSIVPRVADGSGPVGFIRNAARQQPRLRRSLRGGHDLPGTPDRFGLPALDIGTVEKIVVEVEEIGPRFFERLREAVLGLQV